MMAHPTRRSSRTPLVDVDSSPSGSMSASWSSGPAQDLDLVEDSDSDLSDFIPEPHVQGPFAFQSLPVMPSTRSPFPPYLAAGAGYHPQSLSPHSLTPPAVGQTSFMYSPLAPVPSSSGVCSSSLDRSYTLSSSAPVGIPPSQNQRQSWENYHPASVPPAASAARPPSRRRRSRTSSISGPRSRSPMRSRTPTGLNRTQPPSPSLYPSRPILPLAPHQSPFAPRPGQSLMPAATNRGNTAQVRGSRRGRGRSSGNAGAARFSARQPAGESASPGSPQGPQNGESSRSPELLLQPFDPVGSNASHSWPSLLIQSPNGWASNAGSSSSSPEPAVQSYSLREFMDLDVWFRNSVQPLDTRANRNTANNRSTRRLPWAANMDFANAEDYEELSPELESRLNTLLSNNNHPEAQSHIMSTFRAFRNRQGDIILSNRRNNMDSAAGAGHVSEVRKKSGSVFLYSIEPAPTRSDVWPDVRDPSNVPAKYSPLVRSGNPILSTDLPASAMPATDALTSTAAGPGWPPGQLPTEMFEKIASYLSRDDIKAMRLACREFDRHVSQVLFKTVVVPFNTEIYEMLESTPRMRQGLKGKAKMTGSSSGKVQALAWNNTHDDDVYQGHGLDVFRGYGEHMLKFGMSFEVDEDSLAKPPFKRSCKPHVSYWGTYEWPYEEYKRYDGVAGLESTADETPKMKTAFSLLTRVNQLALSIDSGLGWLKGPDLSIRDHVLRHPKPVFGMGMERPDRRTAAQQNLWSHLKACHGFDLQKASLFREDSIGSISDFSLPTQGPPQTVRYIDQRLIAEGWTIDSSEDENSTSDKSPSLPAEGPSPLPPRGMFYSSTAIVSEAALLRHPIKPNCLTSAQKEWLMEMEWAQRAFLSSYMISIMDNSSIFRQVHSLNIARISSRYLLSLSRRDFWDALPGLKAVTIKVIPDWRDVLKDSAGFVETPNIEPSAAVAPFFHLLSDIISLKNHLKMLEVGWASGGEHASGACGRNKHILPAPILPIELSLTSQRKTASENVLFFPYLEELTLTNCWLSPLALLSLVGKHATRRLTKLTLNSVSLSAFPRFSQGGQAAAPAGNFVPVPQPAPAAPGGGIQNTAAVLNNFQALQQQLAPQANPAAAPASADWRGPHREGSWPWILDRISPGRTFADIDRDPHNYVPHGLSQPGSRLTTLELISCGYCRVGNIRLDQAHLDDPSPRAKCQFFTKRLNMLSGLMMSPKDSNFGEIIPYIPQHEGQALETVWWLTQGWDDPDEAEAATFDGAPPGGTGRFSGVVSRSDRERMLEG